jgi:hypothetical protein
MVCERCEDFVTVVGQAIAFCGLSCLGKARQPDRRQKPIVCPTVTTQLRRPLMVCDRREDFVTVVGQAIAFCGLSCLGKARQPDRRQKPIVCPTLTTQLWLRLRRSMGRAILPAAAFQAALSGQARMVAPGQRRLKAGGWLPHTVVPGGR